MTPPPVPPNEQERLRALRQYEILDTDPERDFDDLTLLASSICEAEIATMTLIDEKRGWFKSKVGLPATEVSRDISFCAHGIQYSDWFEVSDALTDERFADNPFVAEYPRIRFYAGAPLVTADGYALGMLCVVDKVPRTLTPAQKAALQALGRQAVAQLELRRSVKQLKQSLLEQQAAERLLRESEGRFRELAAHITDIFWIASPDLGKTHYVSPAFQKIWGQPLQSLYNFPSTVIEAAVPEDRDRVREAFTELATGDTGVAVEFRIARPDGDLRWVSNRGFQIRDNEGRVVRITGVVTDITHRKLAEIELQNANTALVETSRRAGMAEVATNVLHNVGNVLNSVNVSSSCVIEKIRRSKISNLLKLASLLREHEHDLREFLSVDPRGTQVPGYLAQLADHLGQEQEGVIKELAYLQENVEHIKEIVNMQQSLARAASLSEHIHLPELVEDAVKLTCDSLSASGIEVVRDFDDIPRITAEKHKVLQILVNLLTNALEACEQLNPPVKRVHIHIANAEQNVRVTLTDNGIGIPRENLTAIFGHGFTTKRSGHGFGLHSSVLAAREMGGSLIAFSGGTGRGASFVLELPAVTSTSTMPAGTSRAICAATP